MKSFNLNLPGSKSLTNRALIMAALCEKPSQLDGLLESDDTSACKNALESIEESKKIHCHDAGTVARFLPPICAALGGTFHFDANPRLRERPLKPLIDILKQQGVRFEFLITENQMPFIMHSSGLSGGKILINIQDSSQFLSALCMAAPLTQQGMVLQSNEKISSKPYVLMTLKLMENFGISYHTLDDFTIEILPQKYQATNLTIEPDASTASYFFAAAALIQNKIHIKNLSTKSLQGDINFLNILQKIGCQIEENHSGITLTGPSTFLPIDQINMRDFSDTFMTLAIIAPFLPTPTTIHGIRHTRYQESDRITAVSENLNLLGIRTETTEDSLTIFPGNPHGNIIHTHQDHRIAMAFSILGLKIPNIILDDPKCVSKTCPLFFEYLKHVQ